MPPSNAHIALGNEIAPGSDLRLGVLHLDGCLGPTGKLTPWAAQVLAEFWAGVMARATLRLPFLYRRSDLQEIPGGRLSDGYHFGSGEAGIEVTFRGPAAPPHPIPAAQLVRLLRELGPAFANGASVTSMSNPSALVDALLLTRLVEGIAQGCPEAGGMPWSPQLRDRQPRSVRRLLRQLGVDAVAEPALLRGMFSRGVVRGNYRRAQADTRMGLRTPDWRPRVVWVS
jgi:hypothetical protein